MENHFKTMAFKGFITLSLCVFLVQIQPILCQNYCLRFYGNGVQDVDRVKFLLDVPASPLDVGFDFTIEFQIRATFSDNPSGTGVVSGPSDDWVLGHIVVDRDIFGSGDYGDFGISLAGGRMAFGVNNGTDSYTLVSNASIADDQWHHVAVTRQHTSGEMRIFIDGVPDISATSPVTGNISYRDGRPTSWPNDPFLVLGAEKHDYDPSAYPSFNGFLDELRISTGVRYSSAYTPMAYLQDDTQTVGLFHMDEGQGSLLTNTATVGSGFNGQIQYGGQPAGPVWTLRESVSAPLFEPSGVELRTMDGRLWLFHRAAPLAFEKVTLFTLTGHVLMQFQNVATPFEIPIQNMTPQLIFLTLQHVGGMETLKTVVGS